MKNLRKLQMFIARCENARFEPIVEDENYYQANVVGIGTSIYGMEEIFNNYKAQEMSQPSDTVVISVSVHNRLQVWIKK